jgi:hypothetical protein
MGRMLTITNSKESSLGVKKRGIKRDFAIGQNTIKYVVISIFTVLALAYLTQATEGANRSLKLQDINSKKTEMELKKERLEIEKVRLQSLQQIDQNIEKPVMEPVSKVNHLDKNNHDLAAVN